MLLIDWQYFGTIHYFQTISKQSVISFDTSAPFTKMNFKNRTIIATAQGPLTLSIPLIGGRTQRIPINECCIAYDAPWQAQHFKAIKTSYQRAPFFEYYEEGIEKLFENKPEKLIDFLHLVHIWIRNQLKGKWEIEQESLVLNQDKFKYFDHFLPKNYHSILNPIRYQQVFEDKTGFLPNLSILDLLFCTGGKQSLQLIQAS